MSKKHKKFQTQGSHLPQASGDVTAEYGIIRKDLTRVVILNIIILAALLSVYYTNAHSHYLENLTSKFLHI